MPLSKRLVLVFVELLFALVISVPIAFIFMLALGASHAEWPWVPAFGFWTTYIFMVALMLVNKAVEKSVEKSFAMSERRRK